MRIMETKSEQSIEHKLSFSDKGGYVFISYSSANQIYAEATRKLLQQENIKTWMAPYDIPAGSKYAYVINDAIKYCSCVLLLLTEEAQTSEFVEREVERAVSYKKSIISMHLDESKLNSGFSYFLGSGQIVPVKSIDKTSEDIKKVLNGIKGFYGKCSDEEIHNDVQCNNAVNDYAKDYNTEGRHNVCDYIVGFLGLSILILPYVTQWFDLKYNWLPESLEKFFNDYTQVDLRWLTLMIIVMVYIIYEFAVKNDFKYVQKKYAEKNIGEKFLECDFDEFITKLLSMDNMAGIVKNTETNSEQQSDYPINRKFKGMELGSLNGKTVDYVYVDYSKLPSPDNISILYLDGKTGKHRAVKFLSKQGYIYREEKEDILHFEKNGNVIKLAYTEAGFSMLALEITKAEATSRIRERTYEAWNNSFIRETKLGIKEIKKVAKRYLKDLESKYYAMDKKKQNLLIISALMIYVILGISGIVLLSL